MIDDPAQFVARVIEELGPLKPVNGKRITERAELSALSNAVVVTMEAEATYYARYAISCIDLRRAKGFPEIAVWMIRNERLMAHRNMMELASGCAAPDVAPEVAPVRKAKAPVVPSDRCEIDL